MSPGSTNPARAAALALTAALSLLLGGCASHAGEFRVSSLESIYSPAGAFWGFVRITDSTVFVHVDSASVEVSGLSSPASPPGMTHLTVRALLVTTKETGWRELAASDEFLVGETFRWGETRHVGAHVFVMPRPDDVPLDSAWVVFEFQAGRASGAMGRPVRTFACSPTNLTGRSADAKRRALALRRDYLQACQLVP